MIQIQRQWSAAGTRVFKIAFDFQRGAALAAAFVGRSIRVALPSAPAAALWCRFCGFRFDSAEVAPDI